MNVCFIFTEETSEHRMGSNSEVSWNMHHRRFQENKTPCVESEIFHSMVENTSTNHVQMWTAWAGSKCVTSKKNICFEFMFWVYDKSRIFLFCFEYTFPLLLYSFMVLCDTWLGVFVEHFAFDWRFSFNFIPLLHEWNWKQIAFSTMEAYRFTGCHKTQVLCLALRFLTVCIRTQNLPEVKDNISLVLYLVPSSPPFIKTLFGFLRLFSTSSVAVGPQKVENVHKKCFWELIQQSYCRSG